MANEIEIFGKRVEFATDKHGADACDYCALQKICEKVGINDPMPCEDASGRSGRYFREIV